jgi:glycosyltransferase involved in cell wall biosynthesis
MSEVGVGTQAGSKLKVLVVAAAVHPNKGSEPGLGWGWVQALSCHHDLWVIAGEREGNREAIELRLQRASGPSRQLKFFYLPLADGPYLARVWPPLYYRMYRQWHQRAFDLAQVLQVEVGFDLVHQLNMQGYREPGYLWRLQKPFVWGPVGGTANVPLRFASILGLREFLYHLAKVTINNLQLRYHPRVGKALARADGFVTSTSDTRAAFLKVWGKDSVVIQDTGPDTGAAPLARDRARDGSGVLRLAWSGLHVSRKALPILLRAVARLDPVRWHLDIVGQGPMTARWRALALYLGVDSNCTWHGWLPKQEATKIVAAADLFVFPSLHEANPTVVMEALSAGVPVICLDHCGMADVVTSDCGVKVPVGTVRDVVAQFAEAIGRLARDPEERRRLSQGAIQRVTDFSWDTKVRKMLEVYERAIRSWKGGKDLTMASSSPC